MVRSNAITRLFRISNRFFAIKIGGDTLDHAVEIHMSTHKRVREFVKNTPEIVDCEGEGMWINAYDMCHGGHAESAVAVEGNEGGMKAAQLLVDLFKEDMEARRRNVAGIVGPLIPIGGPLHGNFHKIIGQIKETFDPKNVANPPYPFPIEKDAEE